MKKVFSGINNFLNKRIVVCSIASANLATGIYLMCVLAIDTFNENKK